jgi:hypothetical protein
MVHDFVLVRKGDGRGYPGVRAGVQFQGDDYVPLAPS